MRSDTQTVTVERPRNDVVAFLAEVENLPRWAIGFAQAVGRDRDRWVVTTGQGEVGIDIDVVEPAGTVDFRMTAAPGVEAVAYARVVPNGDGAQVVFTQFQ